jgi:hypothetical protein
VHNVSTFMSIQYCNEPSIPCTTSQPSCLFSTATNRQYRAQCLNLPAYLERQQTVNTVHNVSTFMSIQYCNEPSIPCTTSQPSCLFRTTTNRQYRVQRLNVHVYSVLQRTINTVHNISTFMSIQYCNKPSIPCTTSQRSCLFSTATNRQYCTQCLNNHVYSEQQRTVNTVYSVSAFMPI